MDCCLAEKISVTNNISDIHFHMMHMRWNKTMKASNVSKALVRINILMWKKDDHSSHGSMQTSLLDTYLQAYSPPSLINQI